MADVDNEAQQDAQAQDAQVPATQVADPTMTQTLDEKIQPKDPVELDKIDINQAVTPGHDMVVNHLTADQELAQGHVAQAIHEAEAADPTKKVSPADVDAEADESPRSSDPEVNGPDQQVPGQTADQVVAASQPDAVSVPAGAGTPVDQPVAPTPTDQAAPAAAPAEAPVAPADQAGKPAQV